MAVTEKLVTSNFNVHNAKQFIESFSEPNGNEYYMFLGKHIPYANGDSNIPSPTNSIQDSVIDVYNNMMFAKKIDSDDIVHMTKNYSWTANTVYQQYSHTNPNLINEKFFAVVDDITEYNVYKCLSNAANTESTIAPSRVGSSADLNPIITGDGYVWKYMYTITKADYDKFASASFIPVTPNTEVTTAAIPGTIEVISIDVAGAGYNNYIANAAFGVSDIKVGGSEVVYGAPESAVAIDDYYTGCVLKVTSGGGVDQYRKIINYDGTASQKKFTLDAPLNSLPAPGDTYEVYPYIYVWGDGNEVSTADARAIIDPVANSIVEVEMLSTGEGYRYGFTVAGETPDTASPTISSVYIQLPSVISASPSFEPATLTPIVSPPTGHGADPYEELFANKVCVSTQFSGTEAGKISIDNDFRQIGIIKDPKFTNVDLILKPANTIGGFSIGETVYQFKQSKLLGTVDVVSGNNVIMKTDQGKISTTIEILNGGTGYDSTANNELEFDNTGTGGSGAAATFANNGSGVITSVTVTSQGTGYESPPTVSVNPTAAAGGSDGQLRATLANPTIPTYDDSFETGDFILINKDNNNFISTVLSVPSNYQIATTESPDISINSAEVSSLEVSAVGVVSSVSTSQITLTDVSGSFTADSKIFGVSSGATSIIDTTSSIRINDKIVSGFDIAVQLSRLIGNFPSGSNAFELDEKVIQDSLIAYARPNGRLHHAEINGGTDDDILYISNDFGVFNLDPSGNRSIEGETSTGILENLSNKYPGDFVKDSGTVLYYENIDAITRDSNKKETIKIILEF